MRAAAAGGAEPGYTLLEVLIAASIGVVIVGLTMVALVTTSESARMNAVQAHYEGRLETAIADVCRYALETRPSLVDVYDYYVPGAPEIEENRLTAFSFPTARDRAGRYVLMQDGEVAPAPHWQGIVVYACAGGYVRRYMDFSPRSYGGPVKIESISESEIVLRDGTVFNLNGRPAHSDQRIATILDRARRLYRNIPAEGASDSPMHVFLECDLRPEALSGEALTITLDTGVLARNHN